MPLIEALKLELFIIQYYTILYNVNVILNTSWHSCKIIMMDIVVDIEPIFSADEYPHMRSYDFYREIFIGRFL